MEEDLAYVHEVGFSGFAAKAAPGLLALLRAAGVRRGLVVDLGCGPGVWAQRLLKAGYDVVGVDASPAMVARARARAPGAAFAAGSFHSVAIPRCDAVTMIGECINYRDGENDGPARLVRLFARLHEALRPGGLLVLDFAGPGRGGGTTQRVFSHADDWAIMVEIREEASRSRLTRRILTFRRVGRLYRRSVETHHLRLYHSSAIAGLLRGAGFSARSMRGYGRFALQRGHAAIVARRLP